MKSRLFYTDQYVRVQEQIKDFLNEQEQFLSGATAKSTRAAGDAIQDILSENSNIVSQNSIIHAFRACWGLIVILFELAI